MIVAVLTCDPALRGGRDYLRQTLLDLDPQVQNLPHHVFGDGCYPPPHPGWVTHRVPKLRPGNADAFWEILRFAADQREDLLFFEDDVRVAPGMVKHAAAIGVPRDLAYLAYMNNILRELAPWGLSRHTGHVSGLFQGVHFSRRGVRDILRVRPQPKGVASDFEVGRALLNLPRRNLWGSHCPDLVRHVGAYSAVELADGTLTPARLGLNWPGDDFDAWARLESARRLRYYR